MKTPGAVAPGISVYVHINVTESLQSLNPDLSRDQTWNP